MRLERERRAAEPVEKLLVGARELEQHHHVVLRVERHVAGRGGRGTWMVSSGLEVGNRKRRGPATTSSVIGSGRSVTPFLLLHLLDGE